MKYILLIFSIVILFIQGICEIKSRYSFEKNYLQYWNLADKSSTIEAKQKYIQKFVESLENGNARGQFTEYNALFLQTQDNGFRANIDALNTLNQRLTEIQKMNPSSFEYNTAIQQITAQEQGEAHNMLSVFQGCYNLANYCIIWNWIGATTLIISIASGIIGFFWSFGQYL